MVSASYRAMSSICDYGRPISIMVTATVGSLYYLLSTPPSGAGGYGPRVGTKYFEAPEFSPPLCDTVPTVEFMDADAGEPSIAVIGIRCLQRAA